MTRDAYAFLSQHIGDLENLETLEHYETSIALYERMFRLEPEVVAYDLHPEYLATKHALALPQARGSPCSTITPISRRGSSRTGARTAAIGVCLDGLGYGADGVLWGGEVLVGDLLGYERVAHVEELPLPGGALAIERPARTAAGWAYALLGDEGLARAARLLRSRAGAREPFLSDEEVAVVVRQVETGENAPLTTSCGRLFDAVAALAGVRGSITYEGQAAIELEMMSRSGGAPYPFAIEGDVAPQPAGARAVGATPADDLAAGSAAVVRLAPLFAAVLDDVEGGREPGYVGSRLHATVAALVLELCRRVRAANGLAVAALTGGVFQNRLLSDLCEDALEADGFEVLSARPRADQRRRRRVGAGRGGGLYCPAPPGPARLSPGRPEASPIGRAPAANATTHQYGSDRTTACASPFPCASPPSTASSRPSSPRACSSAPASCSCPTPTWATTCSCTPATRSA